MLYFTLWEKFCLTVSENIYVWWISFNILKSVLIWCSKMNLLSSDIYSLLQTIIATSSYRFDIISLYHRVGIRLMWNIALFELSNTVKKWWQTNPFVIKLIHVHKWLAFSYIITKCSLLCSIVVICQILWILVLTTYVVKDSRLDIINL